MLGQVGQHWGQDLLTANVSLVSFKLWNSQSGKEFVWVSINFTVVVRLRADYSAWSCTRWDWAWRRGAFMLRWPCSAYLCTMRAYYGITLCWYTRMHTLMMWGSFTHLKEREHGQLISQAVMVSPFYGCVKGWEGRLSLLVLELFMFVSLCHVTSKIHGFYSGCSDSGVSSSLLGCFAAYAVLLQTCTHITWHFILIRYFLDD